MKVCSGRRKRQNVKSGEPFNRQRIVVTSEADDTHGTTVSRCVCFEREPTMVTGKRQRARSRATRLPWAELLRRVFREDVLECNRCGGRRVVLAFLSERRAVKAVLQHLGLPTTGPPVAPARGSPQMELVPWPDQPDDSP